MKKIALIFILFLGSLNFSIAQESSPTKEVTEQSINKYMNEAVGMKLYGLRRDDNGNLSIRNSEHTIQENSFKLDQISRKCAVKERDQDGNYEGTFTDCVYFSQLNWDNFTVEIDSIETLYQDSNLAVIWIYPISKPRWDHECIAGTYNVRCTQTDYWDKFFIYIPKNRVTSCHKAFLHLKELMKEDDPFGN
jgi:hypothetical protein